MKKALFRLAATAALLFSGASLFGGDAHAQSVFCPPRVSTVIQGITVTESGMGFGNNNMTGFCTDNSAGIGAFSAAALSSQIIGDVQASTTQQTNNATVEAVSARRASETEACPEGTERINGVCSSRRRAEQTSSPTNRNSPQAKKKKPISSPSTAPPLVTTRVDDRSGFVQYQADPMAAKFGFWMQGFGYYEQRSGTTSSVTASGYCGSLICNPPPCLLPVACTAAPVSIPLQTNYFSTARTLGFLTGLDVTKSGFLSANDVLIVGMLAGYSDTQVDVSARDLSGSRSTTNASISGPSVGAFVTYANGPFSTDNVFKVDFLNQTQSFTERLAFYGGFNGIGQPFTPTNTPGGVGIDNTGTARTSITTYNWSSDFQYRFPIAGTLWYEPTGGFRYVNTQYGSGAAALGLQDGYVWRLQGGMRFGTSNLWNDVLVTSSITGLVYSDVVVHGLVVSAGTVGGTFFGTTLLPSDQGLIKGRGIYRSNFDFGNGRSLFVQAETWGGQGQFGAGGRAGGRIEF